MCTLGCHSVFHSFTLSSITHESLIRWHLWPLSLLNIYYFYTSVMFPDRSLIRWKVIVRQGKKSFFLNKILYRCGRNRPLTTHNNVLRLMWFNSTSKSSHHEKGKNPDIYNYLFSVWVEWLSICNNNCLIFWGHIMMSGRKRIFRSCKFKSEIICFTPVTIISRERKRKQEGFFVLFCFFLIETTALLVMGHLFT